jgi:hypothetical protein
VLGVTLTLIRPTTLIQKQRVIGIKKSCPNNDSLGRTQQ